jgi:hypothetical protein
MKPFRSLVSFSALLALVGTASAQTDVRVRGTITASDGKMFSVKTADGKSVDIGLGEKSVIVFLKPITLADIKPGDFLGVTSSKAGDGALTALEVRRFPKPLNPGHRPFDGRSDQTMTNATVSATVQSAKGRDLTLSYEGGSQKITVPENASISTQVPGERSQLVPGAAVNLTAADAGGKLTAVRVQVSPPRR